MNKIIISSLIFCMFSSCITKVYYSKTYEDPNYLKKEDFSSIDDYQVLEDNTQNEDHSNDSLKNNYIYNDYQTLDNYYDYSYSARIRRFHHPIYRMGYYGGLYTNYYWYSQNPYHCGISIYSGYNYYDPFYYPYYSWGYSGYYTQYPIFSNYHYGYYSGYNNYYNNDSYTNSYDNNSIYYGPRGSISSRKNTNRTVNNINGNLDNPAYNKFDRNITKTVNHISKEKTINRNTTKPTNNSSVNKNNYNKREISTKNSSTRNRVNTKNQSNSNRNYNNSRGNTIKTNGNRRNTGSGKVKRGVNPRR